MNCVSETRHATQQEERTCHSLPQDRSSVTSWYSLASECMSDVPSVRVFCSLSNALPLTLCHTTLGVHSAPTTLAVPHHGGADSGRPRPPALGLFAFGDRTLTHCSLRGFTFTVARFSTSTGPNSKLTAYS